MSVNVVYGACRVDLEPKSDVTTIVNLKVGKTNQSEPSGNGWCQTPADKRMRAYHDAFLNGDYRSIINKHKYNVDNGKFEGDYWALDFDDTMILSECELFYEVSLGSYSEMLMKEQILHNSTMQWAKQFTNSEIKVVLHRGEVYRQDGELNERTNPYPSLGLEEINESFIKQLNERVQTLLIGEKCKARERAEKELEKKRKELSDLGISFEAEMKKINEISI